MKPHALMAPFLIAGLLSACSNDDDNNADGARSALTDIQLRTQLTDLKLDGDPSDQSQIQDIPDIKTDAMAQLGKNLFFSKSLGGDNDTACVSCHHPLLGGGDDLSLSIGVHAQIPDLLGPGRLHDEDKAQTAGLRYDGGPTVPRNAPTTFNFALYQQSVFHDGRIEKLDDGTVRTPDSAFGETADGVDNLVHGQVQFPVTSPEEMAGHAFVGKSRDEIRQALATRLNANDDWQAAFAKAFNDEEAISYDRIATALAAYEASQLFINSPWKAYVEGDNDAISQDAKEGANLFFTDVDDGGAGCAGCHSGDFFTDEQFHNIAFIQIGRGKNAGSAGSDDFARFRETQDALDMYAFRTPTLLNVSATGPYGHSGSYDSLEQAVRHHLDPQTAVANYDFSLADMAQPGLQKKHAKANSEKALEHLNTLQDKGLSALTNTSLTDDQVANIMAFLHTLTDPCVESADCLQPWIAETNARLETFEASFESR